MKREFLESLGLEKDAIDQIMAENGKDITREKNKADAVQMQLTAPKKQDLPKRLCFGSLLGGKRGIRTRYFSLPKRHCIAKYQ